MDSEVELHLRQLIFERLAEIVAEQKVDQARREKAMEERRRQWQKVDEDLKRLGI